MLYLAFGLSIHPSQATTLQFASLAASCSAVVSSHVVSMPPHFYPFHTSNLSYNVVACIQSALHMISYNVEASQLSGTRMRDGRADGVHASVYSRLSVNGKMLGTHSQLQLSDVLTYPLEAVRLKSRRAALHQSVNTYSLKTLCVLV